MIVSTSERNSERKVHKIRLDKEADLPDENYATGTCHSGATMEQSMADDATDSNSATPVIALNEFVAANRTLVNSCFDTKPLSKFSQSRPSKLIQKTEWFCAVLLEYKFMPYMRQLPRPVVA